MLFEHHPTYVPSASRVPVLMDDNKTFDVCARCGRAAPASGRWGAQSMGWVLLAENPPKFVCPECLSDEEREQAGDTTWVGY